MNATYSDSRICSYCGKENDAGLLQTVCRRCGRDLPQVKFYIRRSGSENIRGTFTLEEIRSQLRLGDVEFDWEVIVSRGQSFGQLKRATNWIPLSALLGGSSSRCEPKPKPQQEGPNPAASFACLTCGVTVRIPLKAANYRCPKCRAEYKVVRVLSAPAAFLLVPQHPVTASRQIPPHVRKAFEVFNVSAEATLDQVRKAYREAVRAYHPDKVAELGSELRQLAEEKTKLFNAAYRVLEEFYAQ